jgi:hypothetical protein
MKAISIWSITGCILACSATWGLAHEWNTVSGHSLEAEFVRKVGTQVYLRAKDGKVKFVQMSQLVQEDQAKIDELSGRPATPTRKLGERTFGERPKFGERSTNPAPATRATPGSAAEKANAQLAAYRAQKAEKEEARRKKAEESKERFKQQMEERKRKSNRNRRR